MHPDDLLAPSRDGASPSYLRPPRRHGLPDPGRSTASEPGVSCASAAELLRFGSPDDVLARIVPGDPLDLARRAARRIRERALLADAEHVVLRAFASVAAHADRWRGDPPLDEWLTALVDRAIDEVALEGSARVTRSESEPRVPPVGTLPAHERQAPWAAALGLDGVEAKEACARFNRLAPDEREAFFAHLVEPRANPDRIGGAADHPRVTVALERLLTPAAGGDA